MILFYRKAKINSVTIFRALSPPLAALLCDGKFIESTLTAAHVISRADEWLKLDGRLIEYYEQSPTEFLPTEYKSVSEWHNFLRQHFRGEHYKNLFWDLGTSQICIVVTFKKGAISMWPFKKRQARRVFCDVHPGPPRVISENTGYLVTTKEVANSLQYWRRVISYWHRVLPRIAKSDFISRVEGIVTNPTIWMVCDSCIDDFDVDHSVAKDYANKWWQSGGEFCPPGCGPLTGEDFRKSLITVALVEQIDGVKLYDDP